MAFLLVLESPSVSYYLPLLFPPGKGSLAGPEVNVVGVLTNGIVPHRRKSPIFEARQSKFKSQLGHKHTVWAWASYFIFRALSIL